MTMCQKVATLMLVAATGCGAGGGGGGGGQLTVTGRTTLSHARTTGMAGAQARTITHVMAVDPESASPRRSLAAVSASGDFELAIETGRPYVLVFVDDTAVGADMVVAMFRARTLDTLSPQL